jgi:RNA 3'-terminal phosphate cyclase
MNEFRRVYAFPVENGGSEKVMQTTLLDYTAPDWVLIRQALSLALLGKKPVAISGGGAFLEAAPAYRPLFDDAVRTLASLGAGRLALEGGSIVYEPGAVAPGRHRIESGPFSSAVELLLLLAPALFHCGFRSVLECSGVTHSPHSCPTAWVREDLLARLERLGFCGSLALKRFGFYGSGGGSLESRLYPREKAAAAAPAGGPGRVTGARIFIARLNTELAEQEKLMLADRLGLEPGAIAIIEVVDASGAGNSIQVFIDSGGVPSVVYREMWLYDEGGAIVFSEEALAEGIAGITAETEALVHDGLLPERTVRELIPYLLIAGVEAGSLPETRAARLTRDLCVRLL